MGFNRKMSNSFVEYSVFELKSNISENPLDLDFDWVLFLISKHTLSEPNRYKEGKQQQKNTHSDWIKSNIVSDWQHIKYNDDYESLFFLQCLYTLYIYYKT